MTSDLSPGTKQPFPRSWQGWIATLGGLGCRYPSASLAVLFAAFGLYNLCYVPPQLFLVFWIFSAYLIWSYLRKEGEQRTCTVFLDLFCGLWGALYWLPPFAGLGSVLFFRVLMLIRPFPLFFFSRRGKGIERMVEYTLTGAYSAVLMRGLLWLFSEGGIATIYQFFGG